MIINPKLKETFKDIEKQAVKHGNTPGATNKYLRRLLNVYKKHLTEDEQLYVLEYILDNMHYRNIVVDPDNVLQMHNIKLRSVFFIFILIVLGLVVVAALFKTNEGINSMLEIGSNIIRVLGL